jgi:hypothetical protein
VIIPFRPTTRLEAKFLSIDVLARCILNAVLFEPLGATRGIRDEFLGFASVAITTVPTIGRCAPTPVPRHQTSMGPLPINTSFVPYFLIFFRRRHFHLEYLSFFLQDLVRVYFAMFASVKRFVGFVVKRAVRCYHPRSPRPRSIAKMFAPENGRSGFSLLEWTGSDLTACVCMTPKLREEMARAAKENNWTVAQTLQAFGYPSPGSQW